MLINLKNKDTLIIDKFKFKCSIGKYGVKKNKIEGDKSTPKGIFKIGELYWRKDRLKKPETKLKCNVIKKNFVWCTDTKSKFYNRLLKKGNNLIHEKMFRRDNKYDLFILIKYNYIQTIKNKGSAIFLHLTKNYNPTAGCVALSKKDFLIFRKIVKKNSLIKIN